MAIVIILAGLGWSGYWFWQSTTLRTEIERWFEDRRSEGWQAEYGDLAIRGFPNRLDITLTDPVLADPDTNLVWSAPFLQILSLVYKPGHHILAFADSQTVSGTDGAWQITSDGLRASVISEPGGRIMRLGLEAAVLNLDGPDQALALAGLAGALHEVETRPRTYRVALSADAAAGRPGTLPQITTGRFDALALDAQVRFDQDWQRASVQDGRPQPERIELRLAEYRSGGLELKLAGDLDVDARGRADGSLSLKAVNWREMLAQARDAGRIGDGLAQTLEQGLGLLAGLSGNAQTLDLPLGFDEGRVSLGPIPLGKAPLLRLP
nr:DUF2125 domain-containing protein [Thalassococcus arenae]